VTAAWAACSHGQTAALFGCCRGLQCVLWCSAPLRVAVCCSAVQCVAECVVVLGCVAGCVVVFCRVKCALQGVLWCFTLENTTTHPATQQNPTTHSERTAPHCNTLQHDVERNTTTHPAPHSTALQRTAPHCTTLQHTATHCNT